MVFHRTAMQGVWLLLAAVCGQAAAEEPLFTCRIGDSPVVSGLVAGSNNLSMVLRPDAGEHPLIAYFDNPPVNVLKLLVCGDADCGSGLTRLIDSNAQPFSVDLSLTLRGGGEPVLSYYSQLNPVGARLYLCGDAACSSGVTRTLTTASMFGITTSVSLSPGNRPFVAFGDRRVSDRLHACRCDTPDCATHQCRLLSSNPTGGLYPSTLWREHDQTALIAHTATYTQAYQCANADCSSGINHIVSTPVQGAAYSAMRSRPDGRPLIVYGNFSGASSAQPGVPTLVDCADINCTSASSRVLDPVPRQLRIVRMAMRPGGRAFIVYGEVQGARSLYFYQCADRNCSRGRGGVISSSSEISFDAGVRSDDTAVIAFRPYNSGEIRLAYCSLPTDRIFIDDFDPR